jgi:hypothetical protein
MISGGFNMSDFERIRQFQPIVESIGKDDYLRNSIELWVG